MFQKKMDEMFNGLANVFGIGDEILNTGFGDQGKDHSDTFGKVLQVYRQGNLKLNKISVFSDVLAFPTLAK